jgi:hypothetical protein
MCDVACGHVSPHCYSVCFTRWLTRWSKGCSSDEATAPKLPNNEDIVNRICGW